MTFLVRPEHEELRASVRGFLADAVPESEVRRLADDERGYDPDVWARMATQLGLPGLIIPEEYGGSGYGHTELGVVFEELGRALAPSPLFGSVALAANLLLCCDDEQARRTYLPGIAAGATLATVALAEPPGAAAGRTGGWDADAVACAAEPAPEGWRLTGEKTYVVDGHVADVIFVVARTSSGVSVFAVDGDAAGLTRTPLTTLDRTRRQAGLTFTDTPARLVGADGGGWPAVERMRDLAAVALAAEQAGGAARVLEMAVEYAKTRVQFGRPIGSFQAIKHMCADLLVEVESLTSAARYAAGAADTGDPALAEVASLAAVAGADGFVKVAADNIQIHGGIGFTWEHPAHLYLRRARTDAWLLGGPAYHRERYLALTDIAKVPVAAAAEEEAADDGGEVGREVREWLAANFDPELPQAEWIAKVVESGWAAPRWPKEWYGKDLSDADARVVEREFRAAGAPGSGQDRHNLWANTVLAYGSDDMKRRFIGPLLRGELNMCLLYSEPGAGSDLAGLRTRADRDGERWVVNGQKVWTSGAATADYGMLVARTNWDVPKHRGISFFYFPMKQPGVEVRPLHQITGESHFNEVFITDAEVPDANRLGEVDAGWRVLQTALAYERSLMGDRARESRSATRVSTSPDGPARAGDSDLMDLAREVGRADDPVLRQKIAYVYGLRTLNRWNGQRAKAELARGTSSSIMSVGKLAMSRILHEAARARTEIIGAETMLDGPGNPRADETNFLAFNAYFTSIGGGTDQIQRNIIAERILGLPKEPEVDRDVPFREVPGN